MPIEQLEHNNPIITEAATLPRANTISAVNRLALGLLVIIVGLIYLASAWGLFGVRFGLDWSRLWPLTLVLIGLSLLRARPLQLILISTLTLVVAAGAVFFIMLGDIQPRVEALQNDQATVVTRALGADSATLTLSSTVNRLNINPGTADLARAYFEKGNVQLEANSSLNDGRQDVIIEARQWRDMTTVPSTVNVAINPNIPMSMRVNTGASSLNIDLTSTHVSRLDINSGSSAQTIVFGDVMGHIEATLNTGASSIILVIPRTVGVRLYISGSAISPAAVDFEPVDNNSYQSIGYTNMRKTLDINIDSGVATISVVWK